MVEGVRYEWLPGPLVPSDVLQQCAALYSDHYGFWSPAAPFRPGARVRLSPDRLRAWVASPDSRLALASHEARLVGYAIAVLTKSRYGVISWVTQFVVHEAYRNQKVGTRLLFSIWGFTDHFAWGLVTANPYAVRALEKATRRRCDPQRIARHAQSLRTLGSQHVPYIRADSELELSQERAAVNTMFFLDHSSLPQLMENASVSTPWSLGQLTEGWEWFAFAFHDQDQISLTQTEIDGMIAASDRVTQQAYSRMLFTPSQQWARHTDREVQLLRQFLGLQSGQTLFDFGCGQGRHSIPIAALGVSVTAIDYVSEFVKVGRSEAASAGVTNVEFIAGDCRQISIHALADAVICLYDVVGTYPDHADNQQLLHNMRRHLRPGGMALLSVMNYELTERKATQWFSLREDPDALLRLAPSATMETTGDIFDPRHYMIDRDTQIVYRKEQFQSGSSLPTELIVRDRRFTRRQIEDMCAAAGFEVVWSRYVRAGNWELSLDAADDRAKEILLLCRAV